MSERKVVLVDVDDITPDPNQPRKVFNEEDIVATAFTIEAQGIINPIEIDENNIIVTGEIRWRAAQKAGLKEIPCVIWKDGNYKRFERQVVENLHHHELTDRERENAIVKLWETGEYPTQGQLGKAVGLSRQRINDILEANEFRKRAQVPAAGISTRSISETSGLDDYTRVQILKSVEAGKIKATNIREVKEIAKTSERLFDKTLEGSISLDRAVETAKTIKEIEEKVDLTTEQKNRFVLRMEQDEELLDKYKDDVLDRVKKVMTTSTIDRPSIEEPIGRTSPVRKIIAVKNDVLDNFRLHLGNCDIKERVWAKKIMIEMRDELNILIGMIQDE